MVRDWLMSSGFLEQQIQCDRLGQNPVCKMWQMRDGCFHLEAFYFQVLPSWQGGVGLRGDCNQNFVPTSLHSFHAFVFGLFVFFCPNCSEIHPDRTHAASNNSKKGSLNKKKQQQQKDFSTRHDTTLSVWSLRNWDERPLNQNHQWHGIKRRKADQQEAQGSTKVFTRCTCEGVCHTHTLSAPLHGMRPTLLLQILWVFTTPLILFYSLWYVLVATWRVEAENIRRFTLMGMKRQTFLWRETLLTVDKCVGFIFRFSRAAE